MLGPPTPAASAAAPSAHIVRRLKLRSGRSAEMKAMSGGAVHMKMLVVGSIGVAGEAKPIT